MQYLSLNFNSVNTSLQAGDLVFYIPSASTSGQGGFSVSNSSPLLFGTVISINNNEVVVYYDSSTNNNAIPSNGDYIMFAKNKTVNTSGLKGYYLEAEFVNNAKTSIELFSVGSEITESSK